LKHQYESCKIKCRISIVDRRPSQLWDRNFWHNRDL